MPDEARHTSADHALGALFGHSHEGADHDHDHDDAFGNLDQARPASLLSLGLDIGSSSTQAVLSRLTVQGGRAGALGETPLYVSPIMATPLRDDDTIDEAALLGLVERALRDAGAGPDDIDTGAVILTGAAAERSNAAAIGERLSHALGDLVCLAAGHHMEARLAAQGSGATAASQDGGGRRLLLVDVGGGTTKLALVEKGEVLATAALAVGGRLAVVDRHDRLVRLDASGARHAARVGLRWARGETLAADARMTLGEAMAGLVIEAIAAAVGGRPPSAAVAAAMLTDPLASPRGVDGVMVSGGVAEYVYGRERRDFGDLGPAMGAALRRRLQSGEVGAPLLEPSERIRATALGASRHTVQNSGDTLYISSHARLLPRRNLPVLRLPLDLGGPIQADVVARAIRARLASVDDTSQDVAWALAWGGEPSHARLHALACGLVQGLGARVGQGRPLYLMLERDCAASLGAILKTELAVPVDVLVVDGVSLGEFDYVDLGRLRLPSRTVPVTIKSLLFGAAPWREAPCGDETLSARAEPGIPATSPPGSPIDALRDPHRRPALLSRRG